MNRTLLKHMIVTSVIAVLGVSTSFAALVMERDQSVDTAPSVNMYRFEVPAELQGTYNNGPYGPHHGASKMEIRDLV